MHGELIDSTLPRKTSSELLRRPYRKPTQVDEDKNPKAFERTPVKELGLLTPYLRKKGCLSSVALNRRGAKRPQ